MSEVCVIYVVIHVVDSRRRNSEGRDMCTGNRSNNIDSSKR